MTTTPIQMRFADVDMLGHVNNVNQQHYFDVGKSDFFAQVLDPAPNWKQEGLITVSTYNDYLAQIRYGEPIAVLTRIEKVGNKSFTLFLEYSGQPVVQQLGGGSHFRMVGGAYVQFPFRYREQHPARREQEQRGDLHEHRAEKRESFGSVSHTSFPCSEDA